MLGALVFSGVSHCVPTKPKKLRTNWTFTNFDSLEESENFPCVPGFNSNPRFKAPGFRREAALQAPRV